MNHKRENDGERLSIREAIVVEGRDDTSAIKMAVDALTIETHGFGIRAETWELIEKAYAATGIIIFTDPDFSGQEIRKKLLGRFPKAKEAFLSVEEATKDGDIGIENASPKAIREALCKVQTNFTEKPGGEALYTEKDLTDARLSGDRQAKKRREDLGRILGVGYANCKGLINRLNKFNIDKEDFYEAVRTIDNKRD